MLSNRRIATDVVENDKLMAALAYFLTPIVPAIILLVDTMKVRPFQRYHAIQALGFFVVGYVIWRHRTGCRLRDLLGDHFGDCGTLPLDHFLSAAHPRDLLRDHRVPGQLL